VLKPKAESAPLFALARVCFVRLLNRPLNHQPTQPHFTMVTLNEIQQKFPSPLSLRPA